MNDRRGTEVTDLSGWNRDMLARANGVSRREYDLILDGIVLTESEKACIRTVLPLGLSQYATPDDLDLVQGILDKLG